MSTVRQPSVWLLVNFLAIGALGACAASGAPDNQLPGTGGTGAQGQSSGGSGSSSGSGSSGGNGGSSGSSSGSNGQSSGTGNSSGSSYDDDSGTSSGSGDDSGTSSGSNSSSGGGSSGASSGGACSIPQRGADPTSASAAAAGPYQTMSYAADASVRMTDAYDVTSAHIYYPVGATAPFTSISIVPGFVSPESSIADWGPFLASWGIVTMTIGTSDPTTGASDTSVLPAVRAAALLDALTTLTDENTRSGSPLIGQLDTSRQAVAGWSMGGGGTLIAANETPSLKAVFAMEPWTDTDTDPSSLYPMDTVPSLIFAGTADGLAGPPMPEDQYSSIPSTTPKMLYEITGGSHYVSTSPTNSTTDMAPDTQSTGNVARFGLSWLKVYLECDSRFHQFLLVQPSDASTFDSTVM